MWSLCVLRKCSAESSALSKVFDLIVLSRGFDLIKTLEFAISNHANWVAV